MQQANTFAKLTCVWYVRREVADAFENVHDEFARRGCQDTQDEMQNVLEVSEEIKD